MKTITLTIPEEIKLEIKELGWVGWSEISKEAFRKKEIFEKYMETGKLSKKDEEFCDEIDWHPVDELPMREEYVKKLEKAMKEPRRKAMTYKEFVKWCDKL